jgi:hypothetical protein
MEHQGAAEPPDYELRKSSNASIVPPPRRSSRAWLVAAALAVIAVVGYLFVRDSTAPPASRAEESEPAAAAVPEPATPLGATPEPIDVPPLDQSDAVVRRLVGALSSHPSVAAWLATDGLVRNLAVVIENITQGRPPAGHLRVLRPSASFQVVTRGEMLVIDPASYQRYDQLAAAAASIDVDGASRVYATLKPRLQEAYSELGHPDVPFDTALDRALGLLLQTPVVTDPIAVRPHGAVGYEFVDPELESLAPAQKQLLRMGARNVRTVQAALRDIALALGMPAGRLPVRGR